MHQAYHKKSVNIELRISMNTCTRTQLFQDGQCPVASTTADVTAELFRDPTIIKSERQRVRMREREREKERERRRRKRERRRRTRRERRG